MSHASDKVSDETTVCQFKIVHTDLHPDTIASLKDVLADAEAGKLSAVVVIAKVNGGAYWIIRSSLSPADRMNMVGQLELTKHSILSFEEE